MHTYVTTKPYILPRGRTTMRAQLYPTALPNAAATVATNTVIIHYNMYHLICLRCVDVYICMHAVRHAHTHACM